MTFKQALESGKRFRRKGWTNKTCFLYVEEDVLYFECDSGKNGIDNGPVNEVGFMLDYVDYISYDWEVEYVGLK